MTDYEYSVVIMTYNQQDYVREAISAILKQDCEPLEILISDDMSEDDTFAAINGAVADYAGPHRILINRNEVNLGITAHINRCFELCSGELVIAASGDDVSMPGRLRKIIDIYKKERPLLIHSRVDTATLNNGRRDAHFDRIGLLQNPQIQQVATAMSLYIGATAAWHRDLIRKYGDLPERDCYEDLIFGFRAALEQRISFLEGELICYRVGQGVSTVRQREFSKDDWSKSRRKALRRALVVLTERRRNARTYGLADNHPIIKAILTASSFTQARMNIHEKQAGGSKVSVRSHPLAYLRAVCAEALNYRKARRRGI